MNKKIKVVIIGGGNISATRHLPALLKHKDKYEIIGVIGKSEEIKKLAKRFKLKNHEVVSTIQDYQKIEWLRSADLAVVGTPPTSHFEISKYFLENGKHVLLEKPMVMNEYEAEFLINATKNFNKHVFMMHNFQFSNGFKRAEEHLRLGLLGRVRSIHAFQYSTETRRLPVWRSELPFGLFYDESPHFIYLIEKIGGRITHKKSVVSIEKCSDDITPLFLKSFLEVGDIPVNIYCNFLSPVCAWYIVLFGEKKLGVFDLFRDIFITVPHDNLHLAKDVISNSINLTLQHWIGTILNGIKMISGNLLYGHDEVVHRIYRCLVHNDTSAKEGISVEDGYRNIQIINSIINNAEIV